MREELYQLAAEGPTVSKEFDHFRSIIIYRDLSKANEMLPGFFSSVCNICKFIPHKLKIRIVPLEVL